MFTWVVSVDRLSVELKSTPTDTLGARFWSSARAYFNERLVHIILLTRIEGSCFVLIEARAMNIHARCLV